NPFSPESPTPREPAARLKDMDVGGVDVQVIFPTIFLEPLSENPRFEAALMKSYNNWMASACCKHPDRLKWAAVLPMRSVPEAVEETRHAKDLGRRSNGLRNRRGNAFEPRGFRPGLV